MSASFSRRGPAPADDRDDAASGPWGFVREHRAGLGALAVGVAALVAGYGGWSRLAAGTPIAVLPRPGWTRRALAGQAARRLARHRRRPGALLAGPPAAHAPWCFVPAAEHTASATAIRARQAGWDAAGVAPLPRPSARHAVAASAQMQPAPAAATACDDRCESV